MGNGEAKELICMTHGHEQREGLLEGRGVSGRRGQRGKKWDNYKSIVNKMHFKKKLRKQPGQE